MKFESCTKKENFSCVYITKKNYDEFIHEIFPSCEIEETEMYEKYANVNLGFRNYIVYFDKWYICEDGLWFSMCTKEFEEQYHLQ